MVKRSLIIGYSTKNVAKHNESDYEFGWGSDFDDDDDADGDGDFEDNIEELYKLTEPNQVIDFVQCSL